jgi:ketosteroid isomerase-like protein
MSKENVEMVRRCYRVFERRDWSAIPDLFDPEVEIDLSRNVFNPHVYRGHAGVERWVNERVASLVDDVWSDFRIAPAELIDAGNQVVARTRLHGKGKGSGVEVNMQLFSVWTLRDSKVVRMAGGYRDRSEALEAVGLSEQDAQA